MDFWKTILVLVRRWYVTVPVFFLSLVITGAIFVSAPTYYESTGLLVLTTPPGGSVVETDPTKKTTLNPLLAFDDGLKITATLLIQNVNSPAVIDELTTKGNGDSYSVSNGNLDGPFIAVKAESLLPENAKNMVQNVLNRIRNELNSRQTTLRAPRETFINIGEVVTPTLPESKVGGKVRAAGAALVLGIAGGLTGAYGAESVLAARRRRREDAADADVEAEPSPDGEATVTNIAPVPESPNTWRFPSSEPVVTTPSNGRKWPAALTTRSDKPRPGPASPPD